MQARGFRLIVLGLALSAAACVHTGPARFEVDLQEAARINTRLGLDYLHQGQTELAMQKLHKALEQDDGIANTHMGLGLVHARFGEEARAHKYFAAALRLEPRNPTILNNYAVFLCELGDVDGAEEHFARALAAPRYLTPEVAHSNAGACYLSQGLTARADAAFRTALEHNPRYAAALLHMAKLSLELEDYLRSRAFLQRYETHHAASVESSLLRLRTEAALGDQIAVQRYAMRLRNLSPGIESRIDLSTGKTW